MPSRRSFISMGLGTGLMMLSGLFGCSLRWGAKDGREQVHGLGQGNGPCTAPAPVLTDPS